MITRFNAHLVEFKPDVPETGETKSKDKNKAKYDFAIRLNNQFSIDIWTDTILKEKLFKLHSISLYNVINLPFELDKHLTNDLILKMLANAYVHSFKKHQKKFHELNKEGIFKEYALIEKSEEEIKKMIEEDLKSMFN